MKQSLIFLFVASFSAQVWSAPVEVIESADLEKRVARLERMLENPVLLQLSDRLADQEKEIQQLGDQVDRLNWRIKQLQKRHQQDMAALQAQIEDLNNKLSELKTASEAAAAAAPAVPEAAATPPVPAGAPAVAAAASAPTPPAGPNLKPKAEVKPKPPAPSSSPTPVQTSLKPANTTVSRAYDAAMTLLRKARYGQAAKAFDNLLKQYGDTQLAPNAAYWAGEAYMAQLDYKQAWPYFEQVIKKYPGSNKFDDSLYRGADALYQLGKKKAAIALLKRLLQDQNAEPKLKLRAKKTLKEWGQAQ